MKACGVLHLGLDLTCIEVFELFLYLREEIPFLDFETI